MIKLNNKGFAVSTILYGLLIILLLVIVLLFSVAQQNRQNTRTLVDQIEEELINSKTTYQEFTPSSDSKMFTVPWDESGWYRIELWGAGRTASYTSGFVYLSEGDTVAFRIATSGPADALFGIDDDDISKANNYPYSNVIMRAGDKNSTSTSIENSVNNVGSYIVGYSKSSDINIETKYSTPLYDKDGNTLDLYYYNSSNGCKEEKIDYFSDLYDCNKRGNSLDCSLKNLNKTIYFQDDNSNVFGLLQGTTWAVGYEISQNNKNCYSPVKTSKPVTEAGLLPLTDYFDNVVVNESGKSTSYSPKKNSTVYNGYIVTNLNNGNAHASIKKVEPYELNIDLVNVTSVIDCEKNGYNASVNVLSYDNEKYTKTNVSLTTSNITKEGYTCKKYSFRKTDIDEIGITNNSNATKEHLVYVTNETGEKTLIDNVSIKKDSTYRISLWQPNYSKDTILPSGNYYIFNKDENKVLTTDANGDLSFEQLDYNSGDLQVWTIAKLEGLSTESTIYYSLINRQTGYAIKYDESDFTAKSSYISEESNYDIYTTELETDDTKSKNFTIVSNGNGYFTIRSRNNSKELKIKSSNSNLKLVAIEAIS